LKITDEKMLEELNSRIRIVAQARNQLTTILPEFKEFHRKTGTPNPFPADLDNKLNTTIIEELYNQLRITDA
jgi:hypothetical protein